MPSMANANDSLDTRRNSTAAAPAITKPEPAADRVLGFDLVRIDAAGAVDLIVSRATRGEGGSVCLVNAHTLVEAATNPDLANAFRAACMLLPDSMIVQKARAFLYRQKAPTTLYSVQLTQALCEAAQSRGARIGLLGGTEEQVKALNHRLESEFPRLKIVHVESPPFRTLTGAEQRDQLEAISNARVQLLLIGLGAPKQEIWMWKSAPALPGVVMVGIGAAFAGLSGSVKTPPPWLHNLGLVWAFRLASEPRRLWKRYLATSPKFVLRILQQKLEMVHPNPRNG